VVTTVVSRVGTPIELSIVKVTVLVSVTSVITVYVTGSIVYVIVSGT
jgi:hypothetical protein